MKKSHRLGLDILKTLNDAGYEAYFVGGFVRDFLLCGETGDIDITTNARPEDIERLFDKVVATGRSFGTMTIVKDGLHFEVTTYRKETTYDNHRHPDAIRFADTLEEDLSRRDFTVNQLVMDKDGNVKDFYGGKEDLKRRSLRTIGEASERFSEDALRMLRAFRFMAKLNFTLEENTRKAITNHKDLIRKISIERVQDELFKLFEAPYKQDALQAMVETGFAGALYGYEKGFDRLAGSAHDYGALEAFAVLHIVDGLDEELWRLPNKFLEAVKQIESLHMQTDKAQFTPEALFHFGVKRCLQADKVNRIMGRETQQARIEKLEKTLPIRGVHDLPYRGADIAKIVPKEKPHYIRIILDTLLKRVLNEEVENEREALKEEAYRILHSLEESENNGQL